MYAGSLFEMLLEWAARNYGSDHAEYLVCPGCDKKFLLIGNPDEWPDDCDVCDRELHFHVPDEEGIIIWWRSWKIDQKWWPQKFYGWGHPGYSYWAWLGKKWFKKPYDGPDWGDDAVQE